jgi:hypothetical protein
MALEQNSIRWRERYYAARPTAALRVSTALADVVADIQNPITKLRFLRDVIDRQHPIPHSFRNRFLRPLSRHWSRLVSAWIDLARSTRDAICRWFIRLLVMTTCATVMVLVLNTQRLEKLVHAYAASAQRIINAKPAQLPVSTADPTHAAVAETIPMDAGATPVTIWKADQGANWELYSNGLRIETAYTVKGDHRHYRVHDIHKGLSKDLRDKPIGIVFHTSESDVWPLETAFSQQLRQSSEALLSYVKRQQAYNYVIDRFGRVFRVVDDETRANHAGYGVWAHNDEVYLDINSAFLGVSFESRWEGGKTLPITRAQLIAGRNLTHYLRQRFAIAPEMCVTHGMTSVSPKQHLIGFHLDWARGFPFAAFGLPDQYAVTPPSMKLFGFDYDAEFVRKVGSGWPGALAGKAEFAKAATERGIPVETLRLERKTKYSQWLDQARISSESIESATNDSHTTTKHNHATSEHFTQRG